MCITLLVIIKIITLLVKSLSLDFRIRFIYLSVYRGLRISRRFLKICNSDLYHTPVLPTSAHIGETSFGDSHALYLMPQFRQNGIEIMSSRSFFSITCQIITGWLLIIAPTRKMQFPTYFFFRSYSTRPIFERKADRWSCLLNGPGFGSSSLKSRWAWGRRWNSVGKHQELQGWWVGNKNWVMRFENLFIVVHDI